MYMHYNMRRHKQSSNVRIILKKCMLLITGQGALTLTYKINVFFLQYHFHVLFLIGLTGVHLMLLVSDSVLDTWQDQLLMVEKNVQISSNLAEVSLYHMDYFSFLNPRLVMSINPFFSLIAEQSFWNHYGWSNFTWWNLIRLKKVPCDTLLHIIISL